MDLIFGRAKFHNSKLESAEKDLDEWIYCLEEQRIRMSKFGSKGSITDKDFMINVLNNLVEEYDVILDGLENQMTLTGADDEEEKSKGKTLAAYGKQFKNKCLNFEKLGISQLTQNVQRTKMKEATKVSKEMF